MTRLLVLDVDGTLVRGASTIDFGVSDAIGELRARGWSVVLASGRRLHMLSDIARVIPVDGLIASEGATVVWQGAQERLAQLPSASWAAIARKARGWKLSPIVCTESDSYVERFNVDVSYAMSFGGARPIVRPFSSALGVDATLLILVTASHRPLRVAARRLALRHRVDVTPSTSGFLSVTSRGVHKGRALDHIITRHFGGSVDRIVAAGNSLNDVSLLRRAEHRIVMPGSPRELLELATEVSDPLGSGGLRSSITRLLHD